MQIDESTDLPPSYEIVMGNGFDIPPPAYHAIVIDSKEFQVLTGSTESPKHDAIQHVWLVDERACKQIIEIFRCLL